MFRWLHTLTVSLIAASVCGYPPISAAADPVYPGKTWETKTPQDVGLDAGKLKAFSDFTGGRGCVVRHGYLVYTWGDAAKRDDVASACKPWYTHFLFKALEDGKIPSLDERVVTWEPRLKGLNKRFNFKDRRITWRHLANQISCYGVREPPGAAFDYSDYNMALFFDTLFLKVYGSSWQTVDEDVLHPLLTDVLQCEDNPTFMAFGLKDRPGRLAVSPRDFARFGLLYLHNGRWRGKQLLTPEHVQLAVSTPVPNSVPRTEGKRAEMISSAVGGPSQRSIGGGNNQTDHLGSYSFAWWTNGIDRHGQRHWPDAPQDAYGAFGHGGIRAMVIIPSLDLIVSWNATEVEGRDKENRALKLLTGSVTEHRISSDPSFPGSAWERTAHKALPRSAEGSTTRQRQRHTERNGVPAGGACKTARSQAEPGNEANEATKNLGDFGRFPKWAPIEIALPGPDCRSRGTPNPFGILVDVVFTSPSGKRFTVPGFYDGDGQGGPDGNVWKVRFSADETGRWTFRSSSDNAQLDGCTGSFRATPVPQNAAGFFRWGRLEAVGTADNGIRYLKFRDGPYWLKAGCDDPENFLGHFENYNTLEKRKAAVAYLAAKGINSLYVMTHTLGGDHNDVWPWLGKTPKQAKANAAGEVRFDVSKLHEWRKLFAFMQAQGVVPYLVLEDDSAFREYDHVRYYRELVARFGDLPALVFNFGEEYNENYSLSAALRFLRQLEELDPYDHPRGIHNVNSPNSAYIDAPQVDFTSIQTQGSDPLKHNRLAIDWINRCRSRNKRTLMIGFDEGRPELDRRAWWSAYLGGGVWEAHVTEPYDRPLSAWEPVWTELGRARTFMKTLPFWEMQPRHDLIRQGTGFCLAKPGTVYALYLPDGGTSELDFGETTGTFDVFWYNPRSGGPLQRGSVETIRGPGRHSIGFPPKDRNRDWAALVRIRPTPPR